MADLLFVAVAIAFFALAAAYVAACERLVGRDPLGPDVRAGAVADEPAEVAR